MKITTLEFFTQLLPERIAASKGQFMNCPYIATYQFNIKDNQPHVKKNQFLRHGDVPTLPDNSNVDTSWCRNNYTWYLMLKDGVVSELTQQEYPNRQPCPFPINCKITISSETLENILNGGISAETAFMQGELAIEGDVSLALKLSAIFNTESKTEKQENIQSYLPLSLDTPALVVYSDVLEHNLKLMRDFAEKNNINIRPHIKTHKTVELARMQIKYGAKGICCAKVSEAEVMANSGIENILIANQVVTEQKIRRVMKLAKGIHIMLAVDSEKNIRDIQRIASEEDVILSVLIEINVGMNRCGVSSIEQSLKLARSVAESENLRLEGIMGYEGHTVMLNDFKIRSEETKKAMAVLTNVCETLNNAGFSVNIVSAGGTGTYDITGIYPGITEIQVGSYVFMDVRYRKTGVPFRNSLFLIATVISKPAQDLAIIDTGLKTLTTEFGMPEIRYPKGLRLAFLSEEHAEVIVEEGNVDIGDQVEIMPSHCCTTINLHDRLYVVSNGIVENMWNISARGKSM